jgi:hypothetical protein
MKSNITRSDSSDSSQPVAETAVYLFDDWDGDRCNDVSGQINMRKVNGSQRAPQSPSISQLTSPPDLVISKCRRPRYPNANTNRDGTQAKERSVLSGQSAKQRRGTADRD